MANMTQWLTDLKRPLNKGQGIHFGSDRLIIRLPIGCQ